MSKTQKVDCLISKFKRGIVLTAALLTIAFCASLLCHDVQTWVAFTLAILGSQIIVALLMEQNGDQVRELPPENVRPLDDSSDRVRIEVESKTTLSPSDERQIELVSAMVNMGFTKKLAKQAAAVVVREFPQATLEVQLSKMIALLKPK